MVLEEILQSPLDCKEVQPIHPKGDQSWVFIGRTDAEAETPIFWPPHVNSAAMNTEVYVSFLNLSFRIFPDICPGVSLLDYMVIIILVF